MTFFPEPLRPSEGREDDRYQVDPIEPIKKSKEPPLWELPVEDKRPKAYIAFLMFIQKLTTTFSQEKEEGAEKMSGDALLSELQELKRTLQTMMNIDRSENGTFCAQFSTNWHRLFQELRLLSHTKRKPLIDVDKLKALLKDIDLYPPNEDHKLGFYLSKFAGDQWLPFPFQEILKRLFSEHQLHQSYSTLTRWVEWINEILQS